MNIIPFTFDSAGIAVAGAPTASASVALPGSGNTIRVVNEGPNIAFLSIGVGAQTATLPTGAAARTCTPVAVGDVTLTIPSSGALQVSAICRAAASAVLTIQVGEGA